MTPISRLWLSLALLVLALIPVCAFPPAPDGMVYGLVKDPYGTPLVNNNCQVVLQTTGGARIATSIQPALAVGVNYAVRVPMDAGILPFLATSNTLTPGVLFQLYVVVQGRTNLPVEMAATYLKAGAPAFQLRQDLTLGTDVNGSGIPDQWIAQFLAQIGTNIPLANIDPNGVYTRDGLTLRQQYLLGNYPNNPTNTFSVQLVSLNAGQAVLAFTAIQGRSYSVSGSTDLQNWIPLSFTRPASGPAAMTAYSSPTLQAVQIQTIQPANAPTLQFFRLQLN